MSWKKIHTHYTKQEWAQIPSLFAEDVIQYLPKEGKILEIGAGLGQDSRYFHSFGYSVVSTDFSAEVLSLNQERSTIEINTGSYEVMMMDISKDVGRLSGEAYDVVYAHLSLHYFSQKQTQEILHHIRRILKKDGIFTILLNTKKDPEYGQGEKIEEDYFLINTISKRYFSSETAGELFSPGFEVLILDDRGETYKDGAKGIHNLIRFIGKKI